MNSGLVDRGLSFVSNRYTCSSFNDIIISVVFVDILRKLDVEVIVCLGESDGFDITPHQVYTEEPSALDLSPIAKHHDSFLKVSRCSTKITKSAVVFLSNVCIYTC